MIRVIVSLTCLFLGYLGAAQTEDATALEARYKTCAKHYIPADKCTPEIYQQLKDKDNAPLDPATASALKAVKDYQTRLRNPASLQLHTAYVTDKGDICLEIGGQNGLGGQTVSRVVFTSKGKWLERNSFMQSINPGGEPTEVDRWEGYCTKGVSHPKLVPGTDVTSRVNQALKDESR
jgi:hypothetical protein